MKNGFTLIEVLIAMMIVAIAFTAILKATENTITATSHLESRMTAHWVASEILTAAQVGSLQLPTNNRPLSGKTKMLGRVYLWQITNTETTNKNINLLKINVRQNQQSLYTLNGSLLTQNNEDATA